MVTDLMMPEMGGFELISTIRRDRGLTQPHIIVMTALSQVHDKVKALSMGANDYTVKPLDANEFKARVQAGIREVRLKKELTEALKSLDRELQMVGRLQRRLLPKVLPSGTHFRAAADYQPCSRAGGDYYDCFYDSLGRLVVTVADVSGHGASAAVLMGMFKALLHIFASMNQNTRELISSLNTALLANIGDDQDFVSAFIGLVDPENLDFNFCSAGHGDMIVFGPDEGQIKHLEAGGTVLGCFETSWQEENLKLKSGQTLILYTDGLIEAINSREEEYGRKRLEKLLLETKPGIDPEELLSLIRTDVENHAQKTPFPDDITLFVMKFY